MEAGDAARFVARERELGLLERVIDATSRFHVGFVHGEGGIGKLKLNPRKGTATLQVDLPGAGSVSLRGKGVKPADARAVRATSVKLAVRPTGKAKRVLSKAGKANVVAAVTFTPGGGTPRTASRTLRLKEAARH